MRERIAAARAANVLEIEQAELRLVLAGAAALFIVLSSQWDWIALGLGCVLASSAHLVWVVWRPAADERRRAAAVAFDIALVSAALALLQPTGAILFGLYVWIMIDHGVRFGLRYLRYARALALAGFVAALLLSDFWNTQPVLGAALALVLITVPHLLAPLVGRLHAASRFSAAADFELRQPMQALSLYASVLEERMTPHVLLELQLSLRLLEQRFDLLVELARIESGVATPKTARFALLPLLERVVAAERPLASRKRVELRLAPTSLSARGDPALLERMLAHLLTSAIRYAERGGIIVGCRRSGSRRLRVEVVAVAMSSETGQSLELSLLQRLGRLLDHAVALRRAAFSIELERSG